MLQTMSVVRQETLGGARLMRMPQALATEPSQSANDHESTIH